MSSRCLSRCLRMNSRTWPLNPRFIRSRAAPVDDIAAAISTLLSTKILAGCLVCVAAIFLLDARPPDLAPGFDQILQRQTLLAQNRADSVECPIRQGLLRGDQ